MYYYISNTFILNIKISKASVKTFNSLHDKQQKNEQLTLLDRMR